MSSETICEECHGFGVIDELGTECSCVSRREREGRFRRYRQAIRDLQMKKKGGLKWIQ